MAFGEAPGPPAGQRQMNRLLELIRRAGHRDLRDARGPLDLTQRQANGKFTRDEADALIELLGADERADIAGSPATDITSDRSGLHSGGSAQASAPGSPRRLTRVERQEAEAMRMLAHLADDVLAAELQRRGWVVMEP